MEIDEKTKFEAVKSLDDLEDEEIVRFRTKGRDDYTFARVSTSPTLTRDCGVMIFNHLIDPKNDIQGHGSTYFGPLNKRPQPGYRRLEEVNLEIIPKDLVRGHRVSYSNEVI